jgi:hypothetical protein
MGKLRILMRTRWRNLYLLCDDQNRIVAALQKSLTALGYTLYDPFGLIPGKAYEQTARIFVAPPMNNWTRILGDIDDANIPSLSGLGFLVSTAIREDAVEIIAYSDGEPVDVLSALASHLRDGVTADDLQHALSGENVSATDSAEEAIPISALPQDVQAMADQLNPKHVNKLFNKFMGKVGKRISGDGDSARDLLRGTAPDWNSHSGQTIRAVMDCLTIPRDYWRTPDFVTLRDAYQLHIRRQRKPDARLYPGDAETMNAVPNALDYTPIYGGKNP